LGSSWAAFLLLLYQAAEKPGFVMCNGDFTSPQMQYFQSRRGGIKPPLRVFPQPVYGRLKKRPDTPPVSSKKDVGHAESKKEDTLT
jgi:hypothetical protein